MQIFLSEKLKKILSRFHGWGRNFFSIRKWSHYITGAFSLCNILLRSLFRRPKPNPLSPKLTQQIWIYDFTTWHLNDSLKTLLSNRLSITFWKPRAFLTLKLYSVRKTGSSNPKQSQQNGSWFCSPFFIYLLSSKNLRFLLCLALPIFLSTMVQLNWDLTAKQSHKQ